MSEQTISQLHVSVRKSNIVNLVHMHIKKSKINTSPSPNINPLFASSRDNKNIFTWVQNACTVCLRARRNYRSFQLKLMRHEQQIGRRVHARNQEIRFSFTADDSFHLSLLVCAIWCTEIHEYVSCQIQAPRCFLFSYCKAK